MQTYINANLFQCKLKNSIYNARYWSVQKDCFVYLHVYLQQISITYTPERLYMNIDRDMVIRRASIWFILTTLHDHDPIKLQSWWGDSSVC